jgi:uncharacterized glyoxalase superfamily protein PhnB
MSVHFESRDVAKALAFYRDVLGFELQSSWPSEGDPKWCSLHLEGQTIMLGGSMEGYEGPDKAFQDENHKAFMKAAGGGLVVYVRVDDIDAYYSEVVERGAKPACEPKNEFYGLRNFMLQDLDGYRLAFYTPIRMESCQSCGMPLADAVEGQMYCQYCVDESGRLRPYEAILEGTITGYFMGMQKMKRPAAEAAAKEHLAKMPAWVCMGAK